MRKDHQVLLPERAGPGERIISFGGGVQSHALLVLAQQGKIRVDRFIYADVGEDSEHPDTVNYIRDVTLPFVQKHGIRFDVVRKTTFGRSETLLAYVQRVGRSIPLPVYMANGAPGRRTCTTDFKILPVDKHIRSLALDWAIIGLGISLDELRRMRDTHWHSAHGSRAFGFWKKRWYPLIDLHIDRAGALEIVRRAGLPVPPRSACWFCPFQTVGRWQGLRQHRPALFDQAINLEQQLNQKRADMGRDSVYLHRSLRPLSDAVSLQLSMFDDSGGDSCDSGYCTT